MSVNAVAKKEEYYIQNAKNSTAQEQTDESIFLGSDKETKESANGEQKTEKNEKKSILQHIADFFKGIGDFFKNLFHINDEDETEEASASETQKEDSTATAELKSPEDKSIANGKIDEQVIQGNRGDCALIATIEALSNTKEGAKAIKDAIQIKKDTNGNIVGYDVHFKGTGETYSFSEEEINQARKENEGYLGEPDKDGWQTFVGGEAKYSKGDKDMFILEMAVEKSFSNSNDKKLRATVNERNHDVDGTNDLLGNVNPSSVSYLLTGEEMTSATVDMRKDKMFMNYDFKFKDTYTAKLDAELADIENNQVKLNKGSEYKIINYTDENQPTVTLKDKNTSKEYTFNKDEFFDNVYGAGNIEENAGKILNSANNDSAVVFGNLDTEYKTKDINGNDTTIENNHAYTVVRTDKDTITFINPHDTSKEITINKDELVNISGFQLYGLNLNEN